MYYSGENGVATGAGMRIGGKFEWNGKKNMRLSLESRLRSESIEHPFDRSVSKISFYFPVMRGYLVTPSRFMISLERDAVLYEHITDTVTALFGLKVGPFRSAFKTELTGITRAQPGDFIIPYPNPFQEHDLSEVKASGELSWPVSIVTLKGTIACRASAGKESVWDKSIMATVRWSWGRVTAKLFSGDKDGGLNYYFSWRFEKKF
jgi:hypothetical protein